MKTRPLVCAVALSLVSGAAFAGGMAEPIMEEDPVVEAASSGRKSVV